ncbi:MAG: hypothetical protein H8E49_03210 [Gammaproteobacteria bacterium]|nr:hypothetical protein [Gammaproteobacteria bacterium]
MPRKIKDYSSGTQSIPNDSFSTSFCKKIIGDYELNIESDKLKRALESAQTNYVSMRILDDSKPTAKSNKVLFKNLSKMAKELEAQINQMGYQQQQIFTNISSYSREKQASLRMSLKEFSDTALIAHHEMPKEYAGRSSNEALLHFYSKLVDIFQLYKSDQSDHLSSFILECAQCLNLYGDLDASTSLKRVNDFLRNHGEKLGI